MPSNLSVKLAPNGCKSDYDDIMRTWPQLYGMGAAVTHTATAINAPGACNDCSNRQQQQEADSHRYPKRAGGKKKKTPPYSVALC